MKKINLLIILILILVINGFIHAQSFNFAPLKLGNIWVYEHTSGLLIRGEVVDTSLIIDSIKYFGLAEGYFGNDRALRITNDKYFVSKEDSTFPEPLHEYKYFKKNARLGDTWQVNYGHPVPAVYTITDTFPAYTFDTLVTGKALNEDFGLVEWDYVWTEEFGLLSAHDWSGELIFYLKGCVIEGKVYGDTTFLVLSVEDVHSKLAYVLYDNYPNPFNSKTILEYSIPATSFVELRIYDIVGKEITTLVSEEKAAGKYSVEFNPKDLPSGIYFYRLNSGDFQQTKKLVLLK